MALRILKRKFDPALGVALKFLFIGVVWILFSDSLLEQLGPDNFLYTLSHLQTVKGLFFVGVTAGVIFSILHNYTHTIRLLKREQEYYFKLNPVPMVLADSITLRFRDANDAALKLLNCTSSELYSLGVQQLISPEERTKFESVLVFIKTGYDKLGNWKFITKEGVPFYANIASIALREQQMFLITFQDVGEQVRAEEELRILNEKLVHDVGKHAEKLELRNEELAYRASQTQHVNEELILVNEQLLNVNKRIVAERDLAIARNFVMDSLIHVTWSFDLSNRGANYVNEGAAAMFGENIESLGKPWFWLDYVHPDDLHITEAHEQKLSDDDESCCCYRIVTRKGCVKFIFDHSKIITDHKGNHFLVGSFIDITSLATVPSNVI